jgi:hypothetical protein
MENIGGLRRTFACATIGLAVSVSLCFAQGDRDVSQEPQRLQGAQRLLGPCDSLDPKVCFDIYRRRMEQLPERKPDLGWLSREFGQRMVGKSFLDSRMVSESWLDSWRFAPPSSGTRMK